MYRFNKIQRKPCIENGYFYADIMKDIIWTLIIVWLIYKFIELFRSAATKRTSTNHSEQTYNRTQAAPIHNTSRSEKDVKNAINKHLNNDGEYIDFEEVK